MRKIFTSIILTAAIALSLTGCGGSSSSNSSGSSSSSGAETVKVVATNFQFDQKEIHVKKGDKVTIDFTSKEGMHGFSIPDYNIDIQGNGTKTFTADKAGTFDIQCSVMCGEGHGNMKAKLIVE